MVFNKVIFAVKMRLPKSTVSITWKRNFFLTHGKINPNCKRLRKSKYDVLGVW